MLRAPVSISHTAYEVLWEREALPTMPAAVSISYPLRTPESGPELALRAFAELNHAGLARDGVAHPDLIEALRLLARPEQAFSGFVTPAEGQETVGLMVAVRGGTAVLVMLESGVE